MPLPDHACAHLGLPDAGVDLIAGPMRLPTLSARMLGERRGADCGMYFAPQLDLFGPVSTDEARSLLQLSLEEFVLQVLSRKLVPTCLTAELHRLGAGFFCYWDLLNFVATEALLRPGINPTIARETGRAFVDAIAKAADLEDGATMLLRETMVELATESAMPWSHFLGAPTRPSIEELVDSSISFHARYTDSELGHFEALRAGTGQMVTCIPLDLCQYAQLSRQRSTPH